MSSRYKIRDPEALYFVTCTVVDWIDVFTRNEYRDIIVESLQYCQREKGMELYAWVIMSNHIHLVIGSPSKPLENIMRDFKKYTSVKLCKEIEQNYVESRKGWMMRTFAFHANKTTKHEKYKLWQEGYHPIALTSNDMLQQKIDYIHNNPVRAGWVYHPHDYVYSSASSYAGLPDKLLDVIIAC